MMEVTNRYIEGKLNSYATKEKRRVFCEEKAEKYKQEASDLEKELNRETQIIEKLKALEVETEERRQDVVRAKNILAIADAGADFDEAMEKYLRAQEAVADVESRMRLVYYGR